MGLASTMPYLAVVLPLVAMHMLVGVASATSPAASTGGCPFARYGTAFASWTTVRPSTPPSLLRHSVASLDPTVDGGKKVREARSASNELFVVGLSHHKAKVEVREKLACPEAEWNALARQMTELDAVDEAAVLSTCNRFEVYFASADGPRAMFEVSRLLSERSNVPLSALRSNLIMLNGQDAVYVKRGRAAAAAAAATLLSYTPTPLPLPLPLHLTHPPRPSGGTRCASRPGSTRWWSARARS